MNSSNFNAATAHTMTNECKDKKLFEKYNDVVSNIDAAVHSGQFECLIQEKQLSRELLWWLHDLGFKFMVLPAGHAPSSDLWHKESEIDEIIERHQPGGIKITWYS